MAEKTEEIKEEEIQVSIAEVSQISEENPEIKINLQLVTKDQLDHVLSEIQLLKEKQAEIDKDVDEVWDVQDDMEDKLNLLAEVANKKSENKLSLIEPEKNLSKIDRGEKFIGIVGKVGIGVGVVSLIALVFIVYKSNKRTY